MTVTWLLYSALVGVLCAAAAYAGGHFFRLLRLPERWVWLAGIVAVLVLSASALARLSQPSVEVGAANAMDAVPLVDVAVQAGLIESLIVPVRSSVDAVRHAIDTMSGALMNLVPHTEAGMLAERLPAFLSVTTTIVLLLVLTLTMQRLRRSRSGWRSHRIGNVSVLVSSGTGPALVGVLRPVIVVPSWLLLQPAEQQELVVRHEREHQRAGDHVMLVCACVATCLLPWNPALWWMLRRLHLAVELDCDARLLRTGARARLYGTLLLDMARRLPVRPYVVPAIVASRTHLERRLLAMTEKNRTRRPLRASGVGMLAVLLGLVACATEMPTAAEIDDMDVEMVKERAIRAGFLSATADSIRVLYVVDGVIGADDSLREISPDDIQRIEILKGTAARARYGERAADGAILIKTGLRSEALLKTDTIRFVEGHDANEPEPLIVLDGVIMSRAVKLKELTLTAEAIQSVEIIKGESAREKYGERGANGVILITSKPAGR